MKTCPNCGARKASTRETRTFKGNPSDTTVYYECGTTCVVTPEGEERWRQSDECKLNESLLEKVDRLIAERGHTHAVYLCDIREWIAEADRLPQPGAEDVERLKAERDWYRDGYWIDPFDSSKACPGCGWDEGVLVKRCKLHEQLDAAECAHADEEAAHADTRRLLAAAEARVKKLERVQSYCEEILNTQYSHPDYRSCAVDILAMINRLSPAPREERPEKPPRPPMLLGQYGDIDEPLWDWFVRDNDSWRLPGDVFSRQLNLNYASTAIKAVNRQASDPAALALYDADLQQKGGET